MSKSLYEIGSGVLSGNSDVKVIWPSLITETLIQETEAEIKIGKSWIKVILLKDETGDWYWYEPEYNWCIKPGLTEWNHFSFKIRRLP